MALGLDIDVEDDLELLDEIYVSIVRDRLPSGIARKLHRGQRGGLPRASRGREAAWAAMPRWRQWRASAAEVADSWWWGLTYRLQPLLCRLGIRHVWAPLGEENVVGDVVATDREICSECEKQRKARPEGGKAVDAD